jgi:hypothetical protein
MPSEEWADTRLETTYENARSVLEAQRETVSDIDEKAMRTVRLTVLLGGGFASAYGITGISLDGFWALLGSTFLVASLVSGVLTYEETSLYLGPDEAYLGQLVSDDFREVPWHRDLIETYAAWIGENRTQVRSNARYLFVTQSFLACGVVALSLAIVL